MLVSTEMPLAWVTPLPRRPIPLSKLQKCSTTSLLPRRTCIAMAARGLQRLQIVAVPDESHMTTPGEVRHVALDYTLFQNILQTGSTTFGVLSIGDWLSRRGCILSILNIRNLLPDASPRVEVECRCSGRFDAHTDAGAPSPWTLFTVDCVPVSDWPVYESEDRQKLAEAEWRVWEGCREVAELMRKLKGTKARVRVEQELAVWAPKEYDREITADEWRATPLMTRHVWCERAESFSFGVLRCMQASKDVMMKARGITSTLERLELGLECIEIRRARSAAELSLKNVFS